MTKPQYSEAQNEALKKAIEAKLPDLRDPDFVKLFDTDGIEVDPDTLEIKGLDEKIKAFRESKPHFFEPSKFYGVDLNKATYAQVDEHFRQYALNEQATQVNKFLASKPSEEALLNAISTGDFRC